MKNTIKKLFVFLPIFVFVILFFGTNSTEAKSSEIYFNNWKDLKNPEIIYPGNGALYFKFSIANGSTAHLVVLNLKENKWRLRPYVNEKTSTTSQTAKEQNASIAINGGFFNLSNGQSASYIYLDSKLVCDPHENKALVENPKLKEFLSQIYNRSEIRFLAKNISKKTTDKTKISNTNEINSSKIDITLDICSHDKLISKNYKLIDSIQAGPQLIPKLRASEEAFIRKQADGTIADSISCNKNAARSAFGLTDDNHALILAIAGKGQDPESSGISLDELANIMKRLGCTKALNFDGGASTSLYLRLSNKEPQGELVCGKEPETKVKSVLLVYPE